MAATQSAVTELVRLAKKGAGNEARLYYNALMKSRSITHIDFQVLI
jgi:hypothetical protein